MLLLYFVIIILKNIKFNISVNNEDVVKNDVVVCSDNVIQ
jgi:hypothetical protein